MKEIGEALKEQRENIGLSIEEVAADLKLRTSQIEAIERGDKEAFKDIFYLKYFVRDYSKYLGLNYEDMVDEFNEFLFDYTSKISLNDIKRAQNKAESKEKRVASPYTVERKRKFKISTVALYIFMLMIVISLVYYIVISFKTDDRDADTTESSIIGGTYESSK